MGIKQMIKQCYVQRQVRNERLREECLVMAMIPRNCRSPFSVEEQCAVRSLYGGGGVSIVSYKELEVFKHFNGFDARYVSHSMYLPLIARRLNDFRYTKIFEDKGLLGYLTAVGIAFPHVFVRRIDGEYYDTSMAQIDERSAIESLVEQDAVIIKDSVDSSGGKSVSKVVLGDMPFEQRMQTLRSEFASRRDCFVAQECVRQDKEMAQFNGASFNTLRITTLYVNGIVSVCNILLRFGKDSMVVDNWGAGGIIVGVGKDGQLKPIGYDIRLEAFKEYNGIVFAETKLPFLPSILEQVMYAHKKGFSLCKLIGWDVGIDDRGQPVIIEVNTSQPGIFGEQLCNGPIFGERTREVIDYIKTKPFVYNKALVRY